jgi:cation diffusion facilitator family transporter
MSPTDPFDLPPDKEQDLRKARRLEIWSLAYIVSAATFIGLTMGTSQAMRTGFYEDVLSTLPAITFLICTRIARRKPNKDFPYGFHGAVSIGYLTASLALVGMGAFLLIESAMKLISGERTTIGGMTLFGHTIWAGWVMLVAIVYTAIPSVLFGRAKAELAPKIHDKILYADAEMMKADWMTAVATAVGVLGVGFGLWWLDPVAAALVSADILHDGVKNVKIAMADLIERRPMKTDGSEPEMLPDELCAFLEGLDWVETATVRLREVGHIFFGEAFITVRGEPEDLPAKIRKAMEDAPSINWRLHEVTITVLDKQPD